MTPRPRRLVAAALALLLAACGPDEAPPAEFSGERASPLLYEVTGPGGDVEGWLLGTIHALPPGTDWQGEWSERLVSGSDELLVEVAELDDRSAISAIFTELATTPGMPPLEQRVAPSLRADLAELVERSGIASERFADTETWAAAVMLSRVDAAGDPRNGVDRALIRVFAPARVRGLETARAQLGIFDTLPEADQRDLLEGTVREWHAARKDRAQFARAWFTGDIAAIERATVTGIMADPELREALLVARNRRWLPGIAASFARTERTLVAVGAAHLVGRDGIAAMLEQAGYCVTRIE
ncbi:TraB/GumN family protein [Qipengyuania nanhaisediminis]|uniref:TraB/GumN family protein n=1 Tax=Qipengyuania nanhaisediminis TaxID=604088 RepID=UPI0038B23ACD